MIRTRTDADLPACVDALHATHLASGYPTAWPVDPTAWLTPDGLLASWVAEVDGVVVGGVSAVAGGTDSALSAAVGVPADGLVVLSRLYVSPAARGRGLARALVGTVVDHAASTGRRAALDVIDTSADAIALYESLGWIYHGTERATWRTQNGEHPQIRFYLSPA